MRIFLVLLVSLPLTAAAEIVTVDFVGVLNGNLDEAVYYYENNWKQHRIEARKRGYIASWKLLVRTSEDGDTDILLITSYGSGEQYAKREDNFAKLMDETRPDGPLLLNDKPPGEFRRVVDGGVYTSDRKE